MSYLPRMSKTYKEPEEKVFENPKNKITFNNIPIASAIRDNKIYNFQSVLKQYNLHPHLPPQLPGPSLVEEVEQNEKVNEVKRKNTGKETNLGGPKIKSETSEEPSCEKKNEEINSNFSVANPSFAKENDNSARSTNSKEKLRINKILTKKTYSKSVKKKGDSKKNEKKFIHSNRNSNEDESNWNIRSENFEDATVKRTREIDHCKEEAVLPVEDLVNRNSDKDRVTSRSGVKKPEISPIPPKERNKPSNYKAKKSVNESVQYSSLGNSEKVFIIPSSINYLLRTLSFLIQELDKNCEEKAASTKVKKLLVQISEAIKALTVRRIDVKFCLQTSFSDAKRLEKIYNDLECYIKQIYGENGKLGSKLRERKKIYCELFQKEYELKILNEKLRENDIQNPSLKAAEPVMKAPEIIIQNKNLENEQLLAEVEFNSQELKRFHQTLAEKDWEIYSSKQEIVSLKQKLASFKSLQKQKRNLHPHVGNFIKRSG